MARDKLRGQLSPEQTLRGGISNKGGIITDHRLLSHLGDADQHPISAIIGLQDALDEIAKADAVGFELNVSQEGDVEIQATLDDIRTAVESAKKVLFMQTTDDGIRIYEVMNTDWENGNLSLRYSDGSVIAVAELSENGNLMSGTIKETELLSNENLILIYCGSATEVI